MSYTKYYLYKKQYSTDNGQTWHDVVPEETVPSGDPVGHYSTLEECEQATPATEGYLAIIPRGNGNIRLSGTSNTFQYSFNSGATWNNATSATSITMNDGVSLWFKGNLSPQTVYGIGKFSASTDFDVEGNPASLIYGEYFSGKTTVPKYAFYELFNECTGLINAKDLVLPATTLAISCYVEMFNGCSRLANAPELPATTLAGGCYLNMFSRCTSLTVAPELPATSLTERCYNGMFAGCTSLTKAPVLPASTLVDNCYKTMFQRCSSLNEITCLATDISATNCTEQWVNGVAANGTFTKASGFLGWSQGIDGIPDGWTVVDA